MRTDQIARMHAKTELEILLLLAATAERYVDYYRSHTAMPPAEREKHALRHIQLHADYTERYETARREFLRRFGTGPTLSRIPAALRRLVKRLVCRQSPPTRPT